MILLRLTEHVRAQNWLAVALDFVIVVLGVFIGTQVSNWNDHQKEIAQGARFERELVSDLQADVRRLQLSDSYFRLVEQSARRTMIRLEAGATDDPANLLVDAYTATQYIYNASNRATYDELVATGGLRLIGDAQLREGAVYLYNSRAQDVLPDYVRDSAYRDALRRALPYDVQQAIRDDCGDLRDAAGDIIGLNLPCTLDLPPDRIEEAIAILYAHPTLKEDLRTFVSTLLAYIEDQRLTLVTIEPVLADYGADHAPDNVQGEASE